MVRFFRIIRNNCYSLDELTPKIIKKGIAVTAKLKWFLRTFGDDLYVPM